MRLSWGTFYAFLFLYRCLYSVLGQTLIFRLTTPADTSSYQQNGIGYVLTAVDALNLSPQFGQQQQANWITIIIGAIFNFASGGNPILINIWFQALAFIGIWRLLAAVEPEQRRFLALLVMFPSFSLWSSVASKEAIVVFLVGMLCSLAVQVYRGAGRFSLRHGFFLVALYIFKPHFVPALLFLLFLPVFAERVRQRAALALMAGVVSLIPLYIWRDTIDRTVLAVATSMYNEGGLSTRSVRLLVEPYDYFVRAPEGMLLALIGPTWSEISSGVLHLASFAESMLMLGMLLVYVTPRLPRLPAYLAIVSGFALFWIMFATYPAGIANPGTAVRYRTDWILVVYLVAVVLMSPRTLTQWRGTGRQRPRLQRSQARIDGPAASPSLP